MNLSEFLSKVDLVLSAMSQEEMATFIHDMARTLPDRERAAFFSRLDRIKKKGKRYEAAEYGNSAALSERYEEIKEGLGQIEEGNLCLVGSLNYEYDDWYNSEADEFLFEDPDGVLPLLKNAFDFVHECAGCGEFQYGSEIAGILINLEIAVEGEYQEYMDDPLEISDLGYYHLCTLDERQLAIDSVYMTYLLHPLPDRADAIYQVIVNTGQPDITLEAVMQDGEELQDFPEFLGLWIKYLGNISSPVAEKLLKEALDLTNSHETVLENARKYYTLHPALYEQYILGSMQEKDDRELFDIGKEALETVDRKFIVRSRIALLMSTLAFRQGMQDEAENSLLEAFRSDTSIVNYMRLVMECRDVNVFKEDIRKISHDRERLFENNSSYNNAGGELRENLIHSKTANMLAFFCGEFQYVREHAMNVNRALGWSATFMKCGMAAFLLFLLEGESLPKGCMELCRRISDEVDFSDSVYQQGSQKTVDGGSAGWFWKCFQCWKGTVSMPAGEKEEYLRWIENLIIKRVEGIMEENRRNYYYECAAYIAALGEVCESRGEAGGKQRVLSEYKSKYSRRRAFHRELKAFGMRG
ncbi:MAG: hypothetical protein HFH72_07165 [Lachnospiraceae bacterium]|nr:hypothetical protein [Lachnospiraceae bacterium]